MLELNKSENRGSRSIQLITSVSEFIKLKHVWDELAFRVPTYSPFLSHDWFELWLKRFLKNDQLLIILVNEENETLTIAPFVTKKIRLNGINVRKVELIGNIYSPIRNFILGKLDNRAKEGNLKDVFAYLLKAHKKWDIIDLNSIPEEDGGFDLLKRVVQETNFNYREYFCFGNWFLDGINYSGEEYLMRRPGNIRENVPYRIRKLKRIGNLDFRMVKDGEDIDYYMDLYYDLYSKSWQEMERTDPTFHRELAKVAATNGWLRLGFLFFNGSAIACQFWICENHYAYILKLFYDQKYEKYAPGKILAAEMMKYVIDIDKVTTIDYLHGDDSYKKDWTPKRRERKGIRIYGKTIKGRYLNLLDNKILPIVNKNEKLRKLKGIIANRLR